MKVFTPILFIAFLFIISCSSKKKDDPAPTNNNTNTGNSNVHFLSGNFGDSSFSFQHNVNGVFDGFSSQSQSKYNSVTDEVNYYFNEGNIWTTLNLLDPFSGTKFVMSYNKAYSSVGTSFPTLNDLNTIYPIGSSSLFSQYSTNDYNTDGWYISFRDVNDEFWSTDYSGANQTGSFVNITAHGNEVIAFANYYIIKGNLSCRVYNSDGVSKILTANFYHIVSDYSQN